MKTILLTFALIAITTTNAWAQSFGASQITLRAPGATNSVLLTPGALTGPRTFTFPDGDGQLLVTSGAGTTSPAWLLGGNTLTGPGPGPTGNQLGSLTAHDVTLIAGTTASPGNERLTLNNGTNSVTTGRGTELRLLNPLGTFYTALVAAAHAGNITYTMPLANGTVGQVLRIASSPAPTASAATLEWATVSGGGGGGGGLPTAITTLGANFVTAVNSTWETVTGLNYSVTANTVYNFRYTWDADKVAGSNPGAIYRLQFPAGSVVTYNFSVGGGLVTAVSGANQTPSTTITGSTSNFLIDGQIIVSGTGGTLSIQQQDTGGSADLVMNSGAQLLIY